MPTHHPSLYYLRGKGHIGGCAARWFGCDDGVVVEELTAPRRVASSRGKKDLKERQTMRCTL